MIREMGPLSVLSSIISQSTTNSGGTRSAYSKQITSVRGYFSVTVFM